MSDCGGVESRFLGDDGELEGLAVRIGGAGVLEQWERQ
jgi:hypothetical protein